MLRKLRFLMTANTTLDRSEQQPISIPPRRHGWLVRKGSSFRKGKGPAFNRTLTPILLVRNLHLLERMNPAMARACGSCTSLALLRCSCTRYYHFE
jgi:hypothetical protein